MIRSLAWKEFREGWSVWLALASPLRDFMSGMVC